MDIFNDSFFSLNAFLVSTSSVAFGELGDKTQLLALVFAIRYKKATPIILGILAATLANHFIAALIGHTIGNQIPKETMRWVMGALFIGIALWTLKPDKLDDSDAIPIHRYGIFTTVFFTFFIAEMGDKTQAATFLLAAQFPSIFSVIAGTTLGMMIADVPTVLIGKFAAPKIPLKFIHFCAATIFFAIGTLSLLGIGI